MRSPRENEATVTAEQVGVTVVRSTVEPDVYATITPLGGTMYALVCHIDGEHPRVPEATIRGRTDDVEPLDVLVTRARRLVAEQADNRSIERGTLVVEEVPRSVITGTGMASWPSSWSSVADKRRARQAIEDWADEQLEATGARYYDVHPRGHGWVVSFRFDPDDAVPPGDPRWRALDNGSGEVARSFSFRAGQED